MKGTIVTATTSGISTTGEVVAWEDRTVNGKAERYYKIENSPYWFHEDNVTMTAPTFDITPRYADREGTVEIWNYRNVTSGGAYVGCIVIHDGRWTPLYRTEDLDNAVTVDMLTRAAAQMNAGQ